MSEPRSTASTITDDELDALYVRLAEAEDAYRIWHARAQRSRRRADCGEATIARVRTLAQQWANCQAYDSAATGLLAALAAPTTEQRGDAL